MARPERMQSVQTYALWVLPAMTTFWRCRFGRKMRLVARLEWLYEKPEVGPLPHPGI